MDAAARTPESHVGQGQEPSQFVSVALESVTVQQRRRLSVNGLVAAQHRLLEQRGDRCDPPTRDRNAETQPSGDRAGIIRCRRDRRAEEDLMAKRRKLSTGHACAMVHPLVIHGVEDAHVARRGDADFQCATGVRLENILCRLRLGHGRSNTQADRRVGGAEIPDTGCAPPKTVGDRRGHFGVP